MSIHRSISLWGVWYLQRKSTPKNDVLQLKTLDFWRLWKWRNWCDLEDLVFICGTWSVKTFVFIVSFSLSWVIGNTVLLKGVEEILRKSFQVMLISKSYTYQSLRVKPLEISYSSLIFFSDRDEVLLVSEEFVLTEELGIRQCGLPTSEEHDSPEEFDRSNIRPLLCYAPAIPKYLIHIAVISFKGIYVLSCWAAP